MEEVGAKALDHMAAKERRKSLHELVAEEGAKALHQRVAEEGGKAHPVMEEEEEGVRTGLTHHLPLDRQKIATKPAQLGSRQEEASEAQV